MMESSLSVGRPAPASTLDHRRWWVLALSAVPFMVILDASIVFVALPSIGAELGFSEQGLQWLASGLSNTALQIGHALGVAIVTTVAVSRSGDYLAANEGASPLIALTEVFQSAFLACVALAGIGLALALLLLGRPRKASHERLEPVPATGAAN
jgi:MFS family permease